MTVAILIIFIDSILTTFNQIILLLVLTLSYSIVLDNEEDKFGYISWIRCD